MPNCIEYLGTMSDGLRVNKLLDCPKRRARSTMQPQCWKSQLAECATSCPIAPSGEHAALCNCSVERGSKLDCPKRRARSTVQLQRCKRQQASNEAQISGCGGRDQKLLEHNLASILSVHHAFIQDNENCVMQGTQICRKILHFENSGKKPFLKFWLHK